MTLAVDHLGRVGEDRARVATDDAVVESRLIAEVEIVTLALPRNVAGDDSIDQRRGAEHPSAIAAAVSGDRAVGECSATAYASAPRVRMIVDDRRVGEVATTVYSAAASPRIVAADDGIEDREP